MGFSLRNWLEEAGAQVNPWDHGKTAATVRATRPKAPPARTVRAAPQQSFFNKVRDVFDANTEADQYRRNQAGQSRWYQDQQRAMGNLRAPNNLFGQAFNSSAQLLNTARAGAGGIYGLGRIGAASIFGNDQDYQRELAGVQRTLNRDLSPTGGLGGAGTFFDSPEQAHTISAGDLTKKIVGGGLGVAGELAPVPAARAVKGANLATRTAKIAGASGLAAGTADVGNQLVTTGQVDPRRALIATGIGAATGAAVPLAAPTSRLVGRTAARGAEMASDAAKFHANTIRDLATGNPRPLPEIGDDALDAAARVRRAMQGYPDQTIEGDHEIYRAIQRRLGADVNDPAPVDQLLADVNTYRNRKARLEGGYIRLSDGKDVKPKRFAGGSPYGMNHRPDEDGSLLSDISSGGEFVPSNIYSHPEWYGDVSDKATQESLAVIRAARNNPNAEVTVYRAAPRDELNHGDWVTLSPEYARRESLDEGVGVHAFKVKADELKWPGDSFNEFGFFPKKTKRVLGEGGFLGPGEPQPTTKLVKPKEAPLPEAGIPLRAPTPRPAPTSVVREGGFAKSVRGSEEVSDPTKALTQSDYTTRNTRQLREEADKFADQPIDKVTNQINEELAVPLGNIDDTTVARAIAVAKKLDGAGRHQEASDIYLGLDEHLRSKGQGVQAASLLSNRTPEGLKFKAERDLKKAGVEMTPELRKQMNDALDRVRKAKPGEAHDYAVLQYQKLVSDQLPTSLADKVLATWKAGLLTGIKTQTGNALSNSTFGALHKASDPLAVAIDQMLSLATGQRTKTLTAKGLASGAVEGAQKGAKYLRTGVDELGDIGNKFEQQEIRFKSKAARVYVNGVFRAMGAADKPFRYAQLRNSLYDLAKADGLNKGLKGKELNQYIEKTVSDPPIPMLQTATNEAAKAVLGNDTYLASIAGRVRQAAEGVENPAGRAAAKIATGVLMPFTKVPSAFIGRVFDFTPVGAMKEAVSQIAKGHLDQRALATALSEATTGTAVIYLGAQLANGGLLSGNYPDDPKEQQRWKAEGITPNSVRVGNTWVSLNYLGPIGALFSQGKRAHDTITEGGSAGDVAAGFTGGAVQDALGQSFLQGVSGALDAVSDPKRYAKNYTKNQAGSIIPTLSKDIGEATDKYQRDSNNAAQAIQARIPGARQGLPAKQDVYGNKLTAKTTPANNLANPFRPSDARGNAVTSEVARLHRIDPNDSDLQVTPTPVDKKVSLGDKDANGKSVMTALNDKQRYELQSMVGQNTQAAWGRLISSDYYKSLNDTDKAAALNKVRLAVTDLSKREFAAKNNVGPYANDYRGKQENLSGSTLAYANGSMDEVDLVRQSSSTAGQTPKDRFEIALANYQAKKDTLTGPAQVKQLKSLAKLKIASTYKQDVIDLYGMSKSAAASYLSTAKNGKELAIQLKAYDQALYEAGLISRPKYKYGISGNGRSRKGGRGGRRKSLESILANAYRLTDILKADQSISQQLRNLLKEAEL